MVKRAHMVSKGYIRAWADAGGRVDVLDLEQGRGFSSAIGNATVVSYAYDPEVLTHDLESDYARIEGRGIPVILKLSDRQMLTPDEQSAMAAFLDMHLDRGRYADQTKTRTPAVLVKNRRPHRRCRTDPRGQTAALTVSPERRQTHRARARTLAVAGARSPRPGDTRRRRAPLAANRGRQDFDCVIPAVSHAIARDRGRPPRRRSAQYTAGDEQQAVDRRSPRDAEP